MKAGGGQRKGHGPRQREGGGGGVCPRLQAGVPKDSLLLACVYVSVSLTSCCSVLHEGNTPVQTPKTRNRLNRPSTLVSTQCQSLHDGNLHHLDILHHYLKLHVTGYVSN